MKTRYRLIRHGRGNGIFYCMDSKTGKRTSLGKANKEEARQIVDAKNQAERQPMLNLQLAKAYLTGSDSELSKRTWQHALETLTETKQSANKERWHRVAKRMNEMKDCHPIVGDVRAKGCLMGIELVKDRTTKEPFDKAGSLVYQKAFAKGPAWIPAGLILRMSPPIVMDEKTLLKGLDIIEEAIGEVEKEEGCTK